MSKITTELKVDSIPFEKVLQEINQKEYSSEIMVTRHSHIIFLIKQKSL